MRSLSIRSLNLLLAGLSASALLIAYLYFERTLLLPPCPYCILQRIAFLLLGGVLLLAGVHNPRSWGQWVYALLVGVATLLGLYLSGRHSWMQLQPAPLFGACQQTTLSITEVLDFDFVRNLLSADGDCSEIEWTFLKLSIPMWTFIAFLVIGGMGVINNCFRGAER